MNNLSDHQKGLLTVFSAAMLWSTGGILIKLMTLTPLQISMLRSLIAAAAIALWFRKSVFKMTWNILINSFFYVAVMILFVIATKETTAANAIFLQYTAPIYLLILEPLILKTKFEKVNLITIIIAFGGMALFFFGKLEPGHVEGNVIAILCGLMLASFFLGLRKVPLEHKFPSIFWGNLFTALVCAPALIGIESIGTGNLWMAAALGVLQIAIPYIIFSYGIARVHAIEASLIAMIEPVLNPVWVFLWYGEKPTLYAIIGGIIILGAITLRTLVLDKYVQKAEVT